MVAEPVCVSGARSHPVHVDLGWAAEWESLYGCA